MWEKKDSFCSHQAEHSPNRSYAGVSSIDLKRGLLPGKWGWLRSHPKLFFAIQRCGQRAIIGGAEIQS